MNKQLLILCSVFLSGFLHAQSSPDITADELKKHVYFLASDSLKGRMTGTPEAAVAAGYIRDEFVKYGLQPGAGNGYLQNYPFVAEVVAGTQNTVSVTFGKIVKPLKFRSNFITAPFSGSAKAEAEVVFAGYGISSKKLHYDDYDSVDVKGKIVIIMRYHPDMANPHSEFDALSSFRTKASVAKEKGALGVVFVNSRLTKVEEDKFMIFQYDRAPLMKGFPIVQVKRDIIDEVLKNSGTCLDSMQEQLTKEKKPHSFLIRDCKLAITTDIHLVEETGINVVGMIPGNDPVLKNEFIIIGAHYDHLGFGTDGSLYRGTEKLIHNGADDNASGTAGVLELAQKFASIKDSLKRSILFISFSGEELGLLGSEYFASNPTVPVDKIAAMINLDMIGRLKEDTTLIVYGTGTSSIWKGLVDSLNRFCHFAITKNDEGFGPSDHSSFYAKNIPVLFLFTGTHADYHRPSDKADKLNYTGEETIVRFVENIAANLAGRPDRPGYISVPRKQGERSGGWKVYVGTIPDYSYTGEGLKITGASEGSPAKKAGLKAGDIIVEFGSKKITNIYDYVAILKGLVPGDVVQVKAKRGNEIIGMTIEVAAK